MASTYKTPGVYIEEIPKLPASVAQVATAIPAFIGYTEKAERLNGDSITDPHRITSLLEYESLFGGPELETTITVVVTVDSEGKKIIKAKEPSTKSKFLMYYSMKMYFMNGGGSCYIVSVGEYDSASSISEDNLKKGLDLIEKEDEPTLIVFPDATNLGSSAVFNTLYSQGLAQCNKLKDRFTIADVFLPGGNDDPIVKFREISSDYYKYGAAYYPWLKTTLNYHYEDKGVDVTLSAVDKFTLTDAIVNTLAPASNSSTVAGAENGDGTLTQIQFDKLYKSSIIDTEYATEAEFINKVKEIASTIADPSERLTKIISDSKTTASGSPKTLDVVKSDDNELYNLIKSNLKNLNITIPPSSTIAGVYARVDNDRGVWKAPANVTLSGVVEPSIKITHDEQANLNIDPTSGKSINAIRSFTGKGVMIWGARTLAGNDNEWRYVPVRRLFNMVEESVKKATEFVVFEPNDANTWVRIKAMIENYLTGLWRVGALAGATPTQAFFVNVGLGTTMTAVEILEGKMNIEIGMAAVRPAEFIILKFSHKLQEA